MGRSVDRTDVSETVMRQAKITNEVAGKRMNFWEWMLVLAPASVMVIHRPPHSALGWVILGPMFNPIPLVVLLFLPSRAIPIR